MVQALCMGRCKVIVACWDEPGFFLAHGQHPTRTQLHLKDSVRNVGHGGLKVGFAKVNAALPAGAHTS